MTNSLKNSLPPNPLKGEALRAFSGVGKVPFRGFRGYKLEDERFLIHFK